MQGRRGARRTSGGYEPVQIRTGQEPASHWPYQYVIRFSVSEHALQAVDPFHNYHTFPLILPAQPVRSPACPPAPQLPTCRSFSTSPDPSVKASTAAPELCCDAQASIRSASARYCAGDSFRASERRSGEDRGGGKERSG